jgi:hypothetical protein
MEQERENSDTYMLELVHLMLVNREKDVKKFERCKSQNEGFQGNAMISDRGSKDFT